MWISSASRGSHLCRCQRLIIVTVVSCFTDNWVNGPERKVDYVVIQPARAIFHSQEVFAMYMTGVCASRIDENPEDLLADNNMH